MSRYLFSLRLCRDYGLPVERKPEQRFTLPKNNWRDGMEW